MENGKKSRDSQMVGDYGVEEWRDGGKLPIPTDKSTLIDFRLVKIVCRISPILKLT